MLHERVIIIVKAIDCAKEATKAANQRPRILYSDEDCQKFVKNTVKRAGGRLKDYRGSNDMFRNACSYLDTIENAKKSGRLVAGAVLFILENDGGEPERYKADGKGNASHIGWYTAGIDGYEVVHSSASRGGVYPSTLKNAWTHVGWLKELDYSDNKGVDDMTEEQLFSVEAVVHAAQGNTVNMRQSADKGATVIERVPIGTKVDIIGETIGWKMIRLASGKQGWMMEEFLISELNYEPLPTIQTEAADANAGEEQDPKALLRKIMQDIVKLYNMI